MVAAARFGGEHEGVLLKTTSAAAANRRSAENRLKPNRRKGAAAGGVVAEQSVWFYVCVHDPRGYTRGLRGGPFESGPLYLAALGPDSEFRVDEMNGSNTVE